MNNTPKVSVSELRGCFLVTKQDAVKLNHTFKCVIKPNNLYSAMT